MCARAGYLLFFGSSAVTPCVYSAVRSNYFFQFRNQNVLLQARLLNGVGNRCVLQHHFTNGRFDYFEPAIKLDQLSHGYFIKISFSFVFLLISTQPNPFLIESRLYNL